MTGLHADTAVYFLDDKGTIQSWNDAGAELRPSVASRARAESIYEPDEAARGVPQRELQEAQKNGAFSTTATIKDPKGRAVTVKRVVSLLRDGSAGPALSISLTPCESDDETQRRLSRELGQQAAIADWGLRALSAEDGNQLLAAACRSVGNALGVDRTSLVEITASGTVFRAGSGWPEDLTGQSVEALPGSMLGKIESLGAPVLVLDGAGLPAFAREAGVRSSASVLINGEGKPYGILSAYSMDNDRFTDEDVNFLQSMANVLAMALDRRHNEASLRRQAEALSRTNAELQQFAYIASHDLQEPLRTVASFVQMLEKHYEGQLDAEAREYVSFAVEGIKRMSSLVRDLLTYSRVVSTTGTNLRETDLNGVLAWSLANLKNAIEEAGAEVTKEPLPIVAADSMQLSQVFEQLIANSLKFRNEERPRIHFYAQEEPDAWRISIRDNGIGIDMQYADRIFIALKRLHGRQYPGTGIGLAVSRTIIERHGGRIWVESQPGAGATFHFTIPK
jgi:signal transduction histidine kinase